MILTRPTPSPSVAENANRTLTGGISHFANFSSAFVRLTEQSGFGFGERRVSYEENNKIEAQ